MFIIFSRCIFIHKWSSLSFSFSHSFLFTFLSFSFLHEIGHIVGFHCVVKTVSSFDPFWSFRFVCFSTYSNKRIISLTHRRMAFWNLMLWQHVWVQKIIKKRMKWKKEKEKKKEKWMHLSECSKSNNTISLSTSRHKWISLSLLFLHFDDGQNHSD